MKYYHIGGESSFFSKELQRKCKSASKYTILVLTKINIKNLNQKEHQRFALPTKYKFSKKYNSHYQI